jgi:hypothetical membrane protein
VTRFQRHHQQRHERHSSDSGLTSRFGLRLASLAGLLAFATFNGGWILGDRAQPASFSPSNDDISYLGALTARSAWLYNQMAANTTGALLVVLAVGLWHALAPSRLGRLGAASLTTVGVGMFLDGLFRLDCGPIDHGCRNNSWHAHVHKIESGITVAFTLLSIVLLALAFRRAADWSNAWLPTLAGLPAIFIANVVFSPLGAGAATRAGTVAVLAVYAFLAVSLLRHTAAASSRRSPKAPAHRRTVLEWRRCRVSVRHSTFRSPS